MNSNLFHNIANIVTVLLAVAVAGLLASGCTQDAITQALECSKSFISPAYAVYAIMAVQGLKLVVNVFRDGLTGLVKPQPPVQK